MVLKQIKLTNFRNYLSKEFHFRPETNLIVGPNASGKTNLLEAIYLLATGKNFRVKTTESEAISYKEEIGRVIGVVEGVGGVEGEMELEVVLTTGELMGQKIGKKKFLVNQVSKRAFDFVGSLKAVYFGPEDLELVTDSPSLRRRYLDAVLSQVDREYARASLSYEKGLRSRNRLLEEMRESGSVDRRRLFFWDQLLIKNGNLVSQKRQDFINFLNSREGFGGIGGVGNFGIEYDSSAISAERLAQYDEEEIAAGVTLVGPHRDDFKFRIKNPLQGKQESRNKNENKGRDLSIFGSRGEQRLAILWLKLGEMAFVEEKTKEKPVLLLDDIFSELDVPHRQLVMKITGDKQTIITTADLGMVEKEWLEGVKLIEP